MKLSGNIVRLSPSDLSNHLACRHLTALDLAVAQGRLAKPDVHSHFLDMLRARGDEHEKAYVESLRARGLKVVDLSAGKELSEEAFEKTRAAMASAAAVIVQAPLGHDGFAGYADILLRVEEPSDLGEWSYEVVDTKLSRETRGGTILQLCVYSDVVGQYQGRRPERFHVVSPGEPFLEQAYRFDDFAAYYRLVRERLVGTVDGSDGSAATKVAAYVRSYPEPVAHCDICRWWSACDKRRHADDHLSLVAGIRRTQRTELARFGIGTLTAFAGVPIDPIPFRPQRGSREAIVRVREQARVQLQGRTSGVPHHELLPIEKDRGLLRLPAPSPGDIFLDFEGDPFASKSGLEYLFGWTTQEADSSHSPHPADSPHPPHQPYLPYPPSWRYTSRWALDAAAEKAAFEEFMAIVMARLECHPDLHIYHYAPYEPTALKRLMGKYAVCEDELDRLLRGGVLVDLYGIARQTLIASVERYSIKKLEPFYAFARETPLIEATQALRQVEYLVETGQPVPTDDPVRAAVESYNRDDCLSAAALRDWLETLRAGLVQSGTDVPRPTAPDGTPTEKVTARDLKARALMERLVADLQADPDQWSAAQRGRWLLAQLLAFHRREDKAVWWEFYRLTELDDEALLDEKEAVVGLEFVGQVESTKKTVTNRYTFPPQEVDIGEDAELLTSATHKLGTLVALDREARTVDIRHMAATTSERPTTVLSRKIIGTEVMADALYRLGEWVADHGIEGPGDHRAARELLLRCKPRFREDAMPDLKIRPTYELAVALDESTLAVQGPPGAGKTFTGARMICELVKAGKTVGVCATGHKVIRQQIEAALKAAAEEGLTIRCAVKPAAVSENPGPIAGLKPRRHVQPIAGLAPCRHVQELDSNPAVLDVLTNREADVVGGTVWLWSRPEMAGVVDVLLVDEAGQMSLANVLAISQAARSLILLGDPQQLEQPIKGSHPDGTAVSVLQHVLGDKLTMPEDAGLFLTETRRMHPAACAFTSEVFYESKLHSHAGLEQQAILGPGPISGAGLWYLPVEHEGNRNTAPEEVEAIVRLVAELVGTPGLAYRDCDGIERKLTLADVLIVAPYNAQVYAIREALSAGAKVPAYVPDVPANVPRVGTVDRFQGQEAPVVIYSLTTSAPEDAPRGMEFLYSLNRLNVATSRARCAAIIVGSPRLFEPDCQTPRQMQLANALCRFREMATTLV